MSFDKAVYQIRNSLPGVVWPALPDHPTASLLSLLAQLEQTQWLSLEELSAMQFRQLKLILFHAWHTIPYYRKVLQEAGYHPELPIDNLDVWEQFPILSRRAVQDLGAGLHSTFLPKGHGKGQPMRTSGSTGMPVTVYRNNVDRLFWHAMTLRDHHWHRRDVRAKIAIIRKLDDQATAPPPHGKSLEDWGPPFSWVYATGPALLLDLGRAPVHIQAEWLRQANPDYLLSYPTNVAALARHFDEQLYELPRLREVMTLSETISDDTRKTCRKTWNVAVKDMYSAQEVGYIALQCPETEYYHVQAENLLVEVLDKNGRRCLPGETGRIVVTTLHSFSTPLLRYDIGDYAEVGGPCPCGRGLPTLRRIMGRTRNMLTYPSGDQVWPVVRPSLYSQVAPVRQVQMIQRTRELIEVRLVVASALTTGQERALTEAIHESLSYTFQLDFKYLDQIPRTPGGKFEEFISSLNGLE